MVCGLSHDALVTCNQVLALPGKKLLIANYLLCKTKPVTPDLPSQVRNLKIDAQKNFLFCISTD